eukprot:SAG31_NODE_18179_length_644_cov_1.132110_2_plen_23_part_01
MACKVNELYDPFMLRCDWFRKLI